MSRAHPTFSIDLPLEDAHLTLRVEGTATPYEPGRTSGPPESCYPPEGGEVEIDTVWLLHPSAASLGGEPFELEISPLLLLLGDAAFARLQELTEAALANQEPSGAEDYDFDYDED